MNELERFIDIWENETRKTLALFDALPRDRYDFRPDPDGRSLGEMAWHIAEGEAFGPFAIERGSFSRDARPEGLERPRTTPELRLAFERVHRDALARVRKMKEADLDRSIPFFTGEPIVVRNILWDFMLLHGIHHRGQLALLARQAGGQNTPLFGPTREMYPLKK